VVREEADTEALRKAVGVAEELGGDTNGVWYDFGKFFLRGGGSMANKCLKNVRPEARLNDFSRSGGELNPQLPFRHELANGVQLTHPSE